MGDLGLGLAPLLDGLGDGFLTELGDFDDHNVLTGVEGWGHVGREIVDYCGELAGDVAPTELENFSACHLAHFQTPHHHRHRHRTKPPPPSTSPPDLETPPSKSTWTPTRTSSNTSPSRTSSSRPPPPPANTLPFRRLPRPPLLEAPPEPQHHRIPPPLPHIVHVFYNPTKSQPYFKLTESATKIAQEAAAAVYDSLPLVIDRLVRLLSMSLTKTLPLRAIFYVWRELGLPDDFEDLVISRNPNLFGLCDAEEPNTPRVSPGMRLGKNFKEKVKEWQGLAYVGPYEEMGEKRRTKSGEKALEKRAVGPLGSFTSS
ncbi:hypothetical protein RJ639_042281 [Escallonia herrerae]|uniref:PORR domain-containing protein n=1 Tax=Escallonia herrerae TaxID=1293975 RepID=A0AA88WU59_9ASTE|nr:hypothetical protein RJ639_042281 [Escallonia herrerae]